MFKKYVTLMLLAALTVCLYGCGDEEEPSPKEVYGDDVQAVRLKIFRDGTLTRKLAEYRMTVGEYPTTEQGLKALKKRPKGVDPKAWKGPYIESEEDIQDKWGQEFRYACPGKTFPGDSKRYDLWSIGPDGIDGTDDDILNHQVK